MQCRIYTENAGVQLREGGNITQKKGQTQLVSLEAYTIGKFLLIVALALTALHVICMIGWYWDLLPIDDFLYLSFFDLDEEEGLGTWFSALILFTAGLLSLFQARYPGTTPTRWHFCWTLLAIGFCVLSLDEVAGFHEFVNTVVEGTHWTFFAAILVLVVGILFIPFLASLPSKTRWLLVIAGAIYVGGAVGVEAATIWHEENDQLDTLGYNLWTAVEEFMEMAGIILYIFALLAHIANNREGARLQLEFGRADSEDGDDARVWT